MKKSSSTTRKTIALYWYHAWHYQRYVIGIAVSSPLALLLEQYLPPIILADVLTRLARGSYEPHHVWASFGPSILMYCGLLFGSTLFWRLTDIFVWRLEAEVQRDLAQRIYAHLLAQSANFHANTFGGSIVSQTNKLLSGYIRVADTTAYQVIELFAGLVFTSIILAFRAPLFVILLLFFSLLFISSGFYTGRNLRRLSNLRANNESVETGYVADSVTNILAIKSFAGEKFERKRFNSLTNITHRSTIAIMWANQKEATYYSLLLRIIWVAALVMAIIGVMVFHANVATVFLIFTYTGNILAQLWTFSTTSLRNYNRAFGDASEMTEILQVEPEIKDPVHPEKLRIRKGEVAFKNVVFGHEGVDQALFKGLNLTVKNGEKIGLVGHSGAGKSTFTRLLLRFSDIDDGEILIDGQNIAHLTQEDLHGCIAYVPQEPIMFHRSLKENIRYVQFDATDKEVIAVAKLAHADDFINNLPASYDTLVGERGIKLSGGQRQRVAIARAMLKNAPILLLDEATSALDSESEALIQDALWKLMEGRTAIVIAHRLSTIQRMDRIVVMEDGKIIEQGSHKELLAHEGRYAKLWAHQSGGFINEEDEE